MKPKNYLLIIVSLFISSVVFPQGTTYSVTITSVGTAVGTTASRTALLRVPNKYNKNTPSALVVCYFGTGMTASSMEQMTSFDAVADTANFLVVYPEGRKRYNT